MKYLRPPKPVKRAAWEVPTWPRYGAAMTCEVCGKQLSRKRQRTCDECKGFYLRRMYLGVHWTLRLLIVLNGCKCATCRAEFYKPIKIGGAALPLTGKLQWDHIKPMVDGGSDTPDNWQLLCVDCHKAKTSREARERAQRRRDDLFTERLS